MGGGETSQAVGRFNSDPHFMVGIRRVVRRCPRGATTGGHDLYVIGALGHQLAHRRPNRVLAIRLCGKLVGAILEAGDEANPAALGIGFEDARHVIAANRDGRRGCSGDPHQRIAAHLPQQAQYLVTLGHRVRYLIKLNGREAMHLIELRTSPQGHPSYRRVCQEMHRLIDEVAGHHLVAGAMRFLGSDDVHLPRYEAEARVAASSD